MSVDHAQSGSSVGTDPASDAAEEDLPEHLTYERASSNVPAEKSRECYCTECDLRVTREPQGRWEYGHDATTCPHSIREVDQERAGGIHT